VIATNITDAKDTAATIARHFDSTKQIGTLPEQNDSGFEQWLEDHFREREVQVVRWRNYQNIVAAENEARRSEHQPREKITDLKSLLTVAAAH
jgi:hypothetical protein